MSDMGLVEERRALLAYELTALGADVRRLDFLAWLVAHDRDPEWFGHKPPRHRVKRRVRKELEALPLAA